MRNGQILEGPDAIKAAEADEFPSYANHDEGEARYGLHTYGQGRAGLPHHRRAPAANGSRQ